MKIKNILQMLATASAVAFVVFSCKGNLSEAEKLDLDKIPLQVVDNMFYVQSENGLVKMRVESPRMEVYEHDTLSYDLFPAGIHVYGYSEDGMLETTIDALQARHDKTPDGARDKWSAYGDVVIHNIIKQETMKTDTLYWDSKEHEIWTDCYILMYSPSGTMQGYGMRSDEMARNAILMRPFDNEFIITSDSTQVAVDSVNFVGPMLKK
ncbi:MAG: LPS export ABC transporter periplasmic protein LptC [Bacteroidales bacterium]|nr:LPS export ABC transporter periplasmic protein LptC [Bacteroidales bacterium]